MKARLLTKNVQTNTGTDGILFDWESWTEKTIRNSSRGTPSRVAATVLQKHFEVLETIKKRKKIEVHCVLPFYDFSLPVDFLE